MLFLTKYQHSFSLDSTKIFQSCIENAIIAHKTMYTHWTFSLRYITKMMDYYYYFYSLSSVSSLSLSWLSLSLSLSYIFSSPFFSTMCMCLLLDCDCERRARLCASVSHLAYDGKFGTCSVLNVLAVLYLARWNVFWFRLKCLPYFNGPIEYWSFFSPYFSGT